MSDMTGHFMADDGIDYDEFVPDWAMPEDSPEYKRYEKAVTKAKLHCDFRRGESACMKM